MKSVVPTAVVGCLSLRNLNHGWHGCTPDVNTPGCHSLSVEIREISGPNRGGGAVLSLREFEPRMARMHTDVNTPGCPSVSVEIREIRGPTAVVALSRLCGNLNQGWHVVERLEQGGGRAVSRREVVRERLIEILAEVGSTGRARST